MEPLDSFLDWDSNSSPVVFSLVSDSSTGSAFRMARRPSVDVSKGLGRGVVAEENRSGVVEDPEALKTAKERECYKLFQKMTTRGITVSYDTILRGMLTPTELRMIQKQRDLEQAQKEAAEAAAVEAPTNNKDKKKASGSSDLLEKC